MTVTLPIPATPRHVTAAWLTDVLRASGHLAAGGAVVSFTAETIGEGVGILGELARLTIAYDGDAAGAPATLIVKTPCESPENRHIGMFLRFYEREVRFYQEVAPHISLRVPTCYHAAMDLDAAEFVLVLEDLSAMTVGDQVAGATPAQARTALGALADFHAIWWDATQLADDGPLGWIPTGSSPTTLSAAQIYRDYWDSFVAKYAGHIGPDMVALGARVRDRWEEFITTCTAPPYTIAHTDFRLDNMLFGDAGTIAVIDWQLVLRACGIFDVAYFLNGSLSVDERRAHERELFAFYIDRLARAGVTVDADLMWERFRWATLVHLVYAVAVGGPVDLGNERGKALSDRLVDGYFAAAADHGAALLD